MTFRAFIKNEGTRNAEWFVYVEGAPNGAVMACRFAQRVHAERVAAAMNRAWETEGRLYARCAA